MSIFDGLNRACVATFADGLTITYTHVSGAVDYDVPVILSNPIDEPRSPGDLGRISLVPSDLSSAPVNRDVVTCFGVNYHVTDIKTDTGGMTHLILHKA